MVKKYKKTVLCVLMFFSSISMHSNSVFGMPRGFRSNGYKQLVQNNIGNQKSQKRIVVLEKEKNCPKKLSDNNKYKILNRINKYVHERNDIQKGETINRKIVKALPTITDESKREIIVKNLNRETVMKKPSIRMKYTVQPKKEELVSLSRFKNIRAKYLNKRKQKVSCLVNAEQINESNILTSEKKRYDNNDIQKEKVTSLAYLRKKHPYQHQHKKIVMNKDNKLDRLSLDNLSVIRSDNATNDDTDRSGDIEFSKILRNMGVKDIEPEHDIFKIDKNYDKSINNLKKELDCEYAKNNTDKKTGTNNIIKTATTASDTMDLCGNRFVRGAYRPVIKKLESNKHRMQKVDCQVDYCDYSPQQMIINNKSRLNPETIYNKKHSKRVVLCHIQQWFGQQYICLQRELGEKLNELLRGNDILFNKINVDKGLSCNQEKELNKIVIKVMNDHRNRSYFLGDMVNYFLENGTIEYEDVSLYNFFIDADTIRKKDVRLSPLLLVVYP